MLKNMEGSEESKADLNLTEKVKLTLFDIKQLGGKEDDLDLINEDDDDFEEIVKDDDSDSDDEPLSKIELRDYMRKLGFHGIKKKLEIIKDEEVKTGVVDSEQDKNTVTKTKKEKKDERNAKYKLEEKETSKSVPVFKPTKDPSTRNYMLAKPEMKWYENEFPIQEENLNFDKVIKKLDLPQIMEYENYASKLLVKDVELYQKYKSKSKNRSDFHFAQNVLRTGTTADKMAAYITLVQDSPIHCLGHLEQLIKMVDVRRNRECLNAIGTLKELFLQDLLLKNKKLVTFDKQPLDKIDFLSAGNADTYNKLLLVWHFESCLKQKYTQYINAIVKISQDAIDEYKRHALIAMVELLRENPEQEQLLLTSIVNKLGDPSHKLASKTSSELCKILVKHPGMKLIIVKEVERLLFRPNVSAKACYFGVCFLNQIILDVEDKVVAEKMIEIYFALFRGSTKKGEVNSKLMTALLTGANRAFPFAKLDSAAISEHVNATYKIIPTMNFNIGIQALNLLYHVLDSKDDFSDRFYCSLYRKLLDPELKSTSKQNMFLHLLNKSLKRDYSENRMQAFIKRILQIAHEQTPAMTIGLLILVSEVLSKSKRRLELISEKNVWDKDDGDEEFQDVIDVDDDVKDNKDVIKAEITSAKKVSWVHRNQSSRADVEKGALVGSYDPLHRNPLYAIVGKACPWELIKLAGHYHPTVALYAQTLLDGKFINYNGDPLKDFTLTRFLDRFVYRNPKKIRENEEDGNKITLQRAVLGKREFYKPGGTRSLPIDSEQFANATDEAIPVDEKFMHTYFYNKKLAGASNTKKMKEEDDEDDDIESVASDEFDALLDKYQTGDLRNESEIDFAAQIKMGMAQKSNKKSKKGEDSDLSSEDDEECDFDDEFNEAFKDFDDEIEEAKEDANEEFSDLEESGDETSFDKKTVENDFEEIGDDGDNEDDEDDYPPEPKRPRPNKDEDTSKLFASAEEFSAVLEENSAAEMSSELQAFANKDNAHVKQLRWESERDKWVRGVDWRTKRKSTKSKFSKGKRKGFRSQK